MVLYVPAGQETQAVNAPLFDLPAAQATQPVAPIVEGLTLPVSQSVHCGHLVRGVGGAFKRSAKA